jgi:hypothetical protein
MGLYPYYYSTCLIAARPFTCSASQIELMVMMIRLS